MPTIMKKIFLLTILIFGIISCSSGQKANEKECFYVINVLGAELYEKPSLDSKVIRKIKVGEKIIAKEILKTDQSKKIGDDFYLGGSFIKIQSESIKGFVFSSDLTKIKPLLREVQKSIIIPDIDGKEKSKRIEKRIEKFDNKEYEIEDEITEFENVTYTYTAFNGCFDHIYVYKNLTLNEVYHQLTVNSVVINETKDGNFIEIPRFTEKKGNEYLFEGEGATQDLKIIVNKDGTFTISSYDCT
ncbi:hypothetical protein I602_1963 [Polaribacter dokdonensis DSW-5]|uniref:Lipoprotein n=2 Tax=Polaribacter dokdonensis DSW-5 TaxID=1300348 RepID=A0A0M9CH63_9FLAO|nr:hypothetical protein I602_1963 [Polaribacter dokdonensis DSW-5]